MAEICCGVASESKKSAPCERSSRVTRRKSLEVREFKFITDPICCGVASESKKSAPCERSSRVTRRKSLDVREFKFITDPDVQLEEGKRQKLEIANCSIDVLQNSVEGRDEGSEISENSNSNSNSSTNSSSLEVVSDLSNPPSPLLEDQFDIDRCPKFGLVSVRGRRREMEDAVAIHPSFFRQDRQIPLRLHFFGVYDGHGCSHVAKNCRDRLHQLVKEELENQVASSDWKDAMERSFSRMDEEVQRVPNTNCRCELQTTQCDAVGSTAVVAIVSQNKIVVANCGDSRAVLCRGGKPVPLSIDHKPDRPDELLRIEASGGRVIYWDGPRVLGVLAMSRAIGDDYLKPYVSSEPEITITDRTVEDECLILASDGLWDVVSNDTACSIVRMCLTGQRPISHVSTIENRERNSDKACSDAALLLTKLAMARNSTDNISVVVVDLGRKDI